MTSYSMRSWIGVGLMAVIGVPRIVQFALDPDRVGSVDAVVLAAAIGGTVLFLKTRVELTPTGIERRPGFLRVPWEEIERFEPKPRPDRVLRILLHRTDARRTLLTPMLLPPARGRALLDTLNEALTASRSG